LEEKGPDLPYEDKQKQRAAQRKWAQENRKQYEVTWDQLQDSNFQELTTWKDCINEAKSCTIRVAGNRMKIAALAERACNIKHGGDRRTQHAKDWICPNSLAEFARELKLNHKTIHNWVQVKRKIFDELPEADRDKGIDFTAAHDAMILMNKGIETQGATIAYHNQLKKTPRQKFAERLMGYVTAMESGIEKHGTTGFTPEEKTEYAARLGIIAARLSRIGKIAQLARQRKQG